jgi:hypothetical protein
LDAIYYYVRALATTSLNDSVKQNLIVLFEEARRRVCSIIDDQIYDQYVSIGRMRLFFVRYSWKSSKKN